MLFLLLFSLLLLFSFPLLFSDEIDDSFVFPSVEVTDEDIVSVFLFLSCSFSRLIVSILSPFLFFSFIFSILLFKFKLFNSLILFSILLLSIILLLFSSSFALLLSFFISLFCSSFMSLSDFSSFDLFVSVFPLSILFFAFFFLDHYLIQYLPFLI